MLAAIAEGSQDTLDSYKEQLSTTKMFYTPQSAVDFGASPDLKKKMALVRQFCFDHGLLGANTKSVDDVAIRYPDGSRARQSRSRAPGLRPVVHEHGGRRESCSSAMSVGFLSIYAKPQPHFRDAAVLAALFVTGIAALSLHRRTRAISIIPRTA